MARLDDQLTTAQRREKVVQLRQLRQTYEQIGQHLGISAQAAHKHMQRALEMTEDKIVEGAELVKRLELDMLDIMARGLVAGAAKGNSSDVQNMLRVMKRRAEILGIDAPTKLAPTDPDGKNPYDGITDAEREARLAALFEQAAAKRDAADDGSGEDGDK